jgi:predicted ATPase/DNA-binding SARP family transcriptional activator
VEFRLLGPLQVIAADGSEVSLKPAKVRTLLALLLVRRGRPVDIDQIMDALWAGQPPASAVNLVHGYVRDLRRLLGAGLVQTAPGGYQLNVAGSTVDADRFADLMSAYRYQDALALWHGPVLDEWAHEPWARGLAVRLQEERMDVLEHRLAADIDARQASSVVGELAALIEEAPLRERLWALYIRALYLSGRQADALHAYLDARRILVEEVGAEPGPELRAMESAILAHDDALLAPPVGLAGAVPAPATPLLGRESDLAELRSLLAKSRLVTLTGPGGVGKTRLAIEAARETKRRLGDVWFVELVSSSTREQVISAIAAGLQLAQPYGPDAARIIDYLRGRTGLLVLDNCEQVVDPVAWMVATLLAGCEGLRVLVTSRVALRLAGELLHPLDGLATARAAELFGTRARSANPQARLAESAVRRIVERLEGLPLAVELAGARAVSLTVEQIEAGLNKPLDILAAETREADPRHHSMRSAIGWSYDLLPERDRVAFVDLSVFVGPFTLDAARGVIGEAAASQVERLVSSCLLARAQDVAGQANYRMLEVVRQYARGQADPTRRRSARERHLAYHLDFAANLMDALRTAVAPRWAALARAGIEDLRAAVLFAFDVQAPAAAELVADLYWLWFLDGRLGELRSWARRARRAAPDPRAGARLDRALASTSVALGDLAAAEPAAARQLEAGRRLGDHELIALAYNLLGMAAWARGSPAALDHHMSALQHARQAGQQWSLALVTALAGRASYAAGDRSSGEDLLTAAVQLARALGEPMVLGTALDYQAHAALAAGTTGQAARLAGQALAAYRQIGYQEGIASASTLAATIAVLTGRHDEADRLLSEALEVCQRMGHVGGRATVLECTALLHHERGDDAAASRALVASREARRGSATSVPPELAEPIHQLEARLLSRDGVGAGP